MSEESQELTPNIPAGHNIKDVDPNSMTREDLIARVAELEEVLSGVTNTNEAGGTASVDLYSKKGTRFLLTSRGANGKEALIDLSRTVRFAMEVLGMSTSAHRPPATPENPLQEPDPFPPYQKAAPGQPANAVPAHTPGPVSPTPGGIPPISHGTVAPGEKFKVDIISREVSKNGKSYILARGGRFAKFGKSAWPESLPPEVAASFEQWPAGQTFAPPPQMAYAILTQDEKKVAGFSQS